MCPLSNIASHRWVYYPDRLQMQRRFRTGGNVTWLPWPRHVGT